LNAQSFILLEQDSVFQVNENVDISDGFEDFALDLFFKNNTNDTLVVNWRREFDENCPLSWDVATVDQLYSYVPDINESQIPMLLTPLDSHFIVRQLFWPRTTAGCCGVKVIFYLEEAPDTPIDTGYYYIAINSNECFVTSTIEEELENFVVYPNPVSNVLNIQNSQLIESIQIVDWIGKGYPFNIESGSDQIDISSLQPGVYYLKIKGSSGKALTKKFVKL
jgi:hypothetical protein